MTPDILLVLAILAMALVLFISERLRIDVVALIVLVALGLTGSVTTAEAFSGFSSSAVITIWAVFILAGGLSRTGVAGVLGRRIQTLSGGSESGLILVLMLVAASLSSVMNNVGVAALLLPAVMDIARARKISPSRLLMPLAFATLLGGMWTLIGTPPNLLLAEELGRIDPDLAFGMFDFTGIGIGLTVVGIGYMVLVGRHLLPLRDLDRAEGDEEATEHYALDERLFTVELPADSSLAGVSLAASRIGTALSLNVLAILRASEIILAPSRAELLAAGDRLVVKGRPNTLELLNSNAILFRMDESPDPRSLINGEIGLATLRLSTASSLIGQSLASADFRQRFGLLVLGIQRDDRPLLADIQHQALREGDRLLVQGAHSRIELLLEAPDFDAVLPALAQDAAQSFDLAKKLFIGRLAADSPLAGRRLDKLHLDRFGVTILGIVREGRTIFVPDPSQRVEAGDQLLAMGRPEHLALLDGYRSLRANFEDPPDLRRLESERVGMAEVALSPYSQLSGKTLREIDFRDKYGLSVLAIWREGNSLRQRVKDIPLRFGDALLLFGRRSQLSVLARNPDFLVLTQRAQIEPRREKAILAAAIFVFGVIFPAVVLKLPIALAAVFGALLMVLSGCLTMDEAYRSIQWPAVFLIAGMLPLGIAMEKSGAAAWLAGGLMQTIGSRGELAIMAGLFFLAMMISQVMPNPAVAVLLAPIAISAAATPGVSVRRLAMTIAIAASSSFFSPVGHPANVLVMGPGGYRFRDYVRVGLPLALLVMLAALFLIPIFID
jgi:di/tricarboxylate transporter